MKKETKFYLKEISKLPTSERLVIISVLVASMLGDEDEELYNEIMNILEG